MTRTRRTITIFVAAAAAIAALAGALVLWSGPQAPADAPTRQADAVAPSFEPAVDEAAESVVTAAEEPPANEPTEQPTGEEQLADEPLEAQAETTVDRGEAPLVGQGRARSAKREEWDPAILQIVTNFEKADATVNGLPYPEYVPEGEQEGIVLPAGGPHTVEVTYDGKTKTYRIFLRPKEVRILMVELSGFRGGGAAPRPTARPRPAPKPQAAKAQEQDEDDSEQGRVTVYAKPKGSILIDGSSTGEDTPGTVDVEPGRHEVQVKFEDGAESEKKIIRVRKGSRIKLFFRQRN